MPKDENQIFAVLCLSLLIFLKDSRTIALWWKVPFSAIEASNFLEFGVTQKKKALIVLAYFLLPMEGAKHGSSYCVLFPITLILVLWLVSFIKRLLDTKKNFGFWVHVSEDNKPEYCDNKRIMEDAGNEEIADMRKHI